MINLLNLINSIKLKLILQVGQAEPGYDQKIHKKSYFELVHAHE